MEEWAGGWQEDHAMDVIGRCSNLRMATGVGTVEEDAEGSPKMEEEGQPWRANEPGGWWQVAGRQGWAAGWDQRWMQRRG